MIAVSLSVKNKNLICLRLVNTFLILGTTIGLLALAYPQMVSASVEAGSNTSNSNQGGDAKCTNFGSCSQEAVGHINEAQSAMQNGDTAGAQGHLDLAKQALGG